MKILTDKEKNDHWNAVLYEGAKGCLIGAGVAAGIVYYMKKKHTVTYNKMTPSIKAAVWAMPTVTIGAFFADEGSVKFDEQTYRSDYFKKQNEEKEAYLNSLSTADRIFHLLNENKYKIIVGSWAASLYGSWKIVDRDPYMNLQQKLVQARVYAQAVTVVLLLSTILLSIRDSETTKKQAKPEPEWKKYLEEQGELKKEQK